MRHPLEMDEVEAPVTMNFPYSAKPAHAMSPSMAMVWITATVGTASAVLFQVCVMNNQDAWPAAMASFSLAAMATGFGFFITKKP